MAYQVARAQPVYGLRADGSTIDYRGMLGAQRSDTLIVMARVSRIAYVIVSMGVDHPGAHILDAQSGAIVDITFPTSDAAVVYATVLLGGS